MPTLIERIKNRKPGDPLPNLSGANLQGAVLYGAKFDKKTILDTGETWEVYLCEVVPVLQTIVALSDCAVSELLKPRYRQFLIFKAAGLIPDYTTLGG